MTLTDPWDENAALSPHHTHMACIRQAPLPALMRSSTSADLPMRVYISTRAHATHHVCLANETPRACSRVHQFEATGVLALSAQKDHALASVRRQCAQPWTNEAAIASKNSARSNARNLKGGNAATMHMHPQKA